MRIVSLAVSNIRSFKYDPSLATKIEFGVNDLNLIIGPNGAGKSNLMEIIARLFSNIFNEDYGNGGDDLNRLVNTQANPNEISTLAYTPNSLTKNRSFKDKPSVIEVVVQLDNTDIENLKKIKENKDVLQKIDDKFFKDTSPNSYKQIFEHLDEIPNEPTTYTIRVSDEATHTEPSPRYEQVSDKNIASLYLKAFQMLRGAINTYNDYIRPEQFRQITQNSPMNISYQQSLDSVGITLDTAKPIENLLPLIQILSVQERLAEITLDYTPVDGGNGGANSRDTRTRQFERQSNQRSLLGGINTSQSLSFELLKDLVIKDCFTHIVTNLSVAEVITKVNRTNKPLKELNKLLKWFNLKISLTDFEPSRLYIKFGLEESTHSANIVDLSSGQRAIMNIAAALALTKVNDAVVIIDEIENHLHPSVQTKLREMLRDTSGNSSEIIAITHSSIFVNSKTLEHTSRVYHTSGGFSTIKMCGNALSGARAKTLETVLNYTNGSRIFFTNKVVLVEGPSDELFFTAYIHEKYAGTDIEILSVGGDARRMATWKPIIEQFGVKVYQINDLDQAVAKCIPVPTPLRAKPSNVSYDSTYFSATDYQTIKNTADTLKQSKQYILVEGALEEYYSSTIDKTKKKKMERILDFLSSGDWSRVNHQQEIDEILKAII